MLAVRRACARAKVKADALLVSNPFDVAYLTGFHGGDSYLLVPLRGGGRATILSDSRYAEELRPFARTFAVAMRDGDMSKAVARVCAAKGHRAVGVQGETMTLAERERIDSELAGVGLKGTVATRGLVAGGRMVKDAGEIASIRSAVGVQEAALRAVLPKIRPGMSESTVAGLLEYEMKVRGSSQPSFETIVGAGASSSKPHYRPGAVRLKKHNLLLIDFGATVGGYHSDMTRTFALGKWPAGMLEVYKIVLEAHERAAAGLRAGVTNKAVDALARDYIKSKGYGEHFGHGLGHGIGLVIHEGPSLGHKAAEMELKPGMVVTIEPGIYLPGVGGVRIEDDYVVRARGSENLCTLPRSPAWATLAV